MIYINLVVDNADEQIRDEVFYCVKNGSILNLYDRLEFMPGVKMYLVSENNNQYIEVSKDVSVFWDCIDIVTLKDQHNKKSYDIDVETGDVFPYELQPDKSVKSTKF